MRLRRLIAWNILFAQIDKKVRVDHFGFQFYVVILDLVLLILEVPKLDIRDVQVEPGLPQGEVRFVERCRVRRAVLPFFIHLKSNL